MLAPTFLTVLYLDSEKLRHNQILNKGGDGLLQIERMVVKRQVGKERCQGTFSGQGRMGMEVGSQTHAFVTVPAVHPLARLPVPQSSAARSEDPFSKGC